MPASALEAQSGDLLGGDHKAQLGIDHHKPPHLDALKHLVEAALIVGGKHALEVTHEQMRAVTRDAP